MKTSYSAIKKAIFEVYGLKPDFTPLNPEKKIKSSRPDSKGTPSQTSIPVKKRSTASTWKLEKDRKITLGQPIKKRPTVKVQSIQKKRTLVPA